MKKNKFKATLLGLGLGLASILPMFPLAAAKAHASGAGIEQNINEKSLASGAESVQNMGIQQKWQEYIGWGVKFYGDLSPKAKEYTDQVVMEHVYNESGKSGFYELDPAHREAFTEETLAVFSEKYMTAELRPDATEEEKKQAQEAFTGYYLSEIAHDDKNKILDISLVDGVEKAQGTLVAGAAGTKGR